MKNVFVVLASGKGSRFESKVPKQFVRLAGKTIIEYSLDTVEVISQINEVLIVTRENYVDFVLDLINKKQYTKPCRVICGGAERYDSTWAALSSLGEQDCNLIIHDAVRPFVSADIIQDCIEALKEANAVDVVVDAVDTIVEVNKERITNIPDRRYLKRGQTPQAFRKNILKKAYELFLADSNKVASDDCGIVLKYLPAEPIVTVQGNEQNFKITHQQDIYLADNIIKDGLFGRIDHNPEHIREKLNNKVVVIFGGSSGIGLDIERLCREANARVYSCSRTLNNVDVTNRESVESFLQIVAGKESSIDYVVNTTGLLIRKPLLTMTEKELDESVAVNYVGVLNVALSSFLYLKNSEGMLLNFTSSSFTRGRAHYSLYSSTKAAVVNFTQAIADEWYSHGIKVNCINPERTDTPMRRSNFGIEAPGTLLSAKEVAAYTLAAMSFDHTGQVYSIKNDI